MWGSNCPDFLPQYKIKRHYFEDSIDFVILMIAKLIFLNRFLDFRRCDYSSLKLFSTDIGVISHYLADYSCLAHAQKWVMPKNLVKHLNYEKDLNDYAREHIFDKTVFTDRLIVKDSFSIMETAPAIKEFISKALDQYLKEQNESASMARDLDYALSLNIAIFEYIIESILVHSKKYQLVYS